MIERIDNKEQYDTIEKIQSLYLTKSDFDFESISEHNRFRNELSMIIESFIDPRKETGLTLMSPVQMLKAKLLWNEILDSMIDGSGFDIPHNKKSANEQFHFYATWNQENIRDGLELAKERLDEYDKEKER